MEAKRRRTGLVMLACVLAPLAIGGVLYLAAQAQWAATLALADRMQAEVESSGSARPVLWGDMTDGDAWGDYDLAVAALPGDADDRVRSVRFAPGPADRNRAARDALLDSVAPALAALRVGAHRSEVRIPFAWEDGSGWVPNLLLYRELANLSVVAADRALDDGQPVEAARTILDALQFGRDTMTTPRLIDEMIGQAIVFISLDAIVDERRFRRFDVPAFRVLDRGLARLDEQGAFGTAARMARGETSLFIRTVDRGAAGRVFTWRFPFSPRTSCVDYTARAVDEIEEAERQATGRWADVETLYGEGDTAGTMAPGRVVIMAETAVRSTLARLRMVRMVIGHATTGEVTALADPFGDALGDALGHALDGERLAVWTSGAQGAKKPHNRIEVPLLERPSTEVRTPK